MNLYYFIFFVVASDNHSDNCHCFECRIKRLEAQRAFNNSYYMLQFDESSDTDQLLNATDDLKIAISLLKKVKIVPKTNVHSEDGAPTQSETENLSSENTSNIQEHHNVPQPDEPLQEGEIHTENFESEIDD